MLNKQVLNDQRIMCLQPGRGTAPAMILPGPPAAGLRTKRFATADRPRQGMRARGSHRDEEALILRRRIRMSLQRRPAPTRENIPDLPMCLLERRQPLSGDQRTLEATPIAIMLVRTPTWTTCDDQRACATPLKCMLIDLQCSQRRAGHAVIAPGAMSQDHQPPLTPVRGPSVAIIIRSPAGSRSLSINHPKRTHHLTNHPQNQLVRTTTELRHSAEHPWLAAPRSR